MLRQKITASRRIACIALLMLAAAHSAAADTPGDQAEPALGAALPGITLPAIETRPADSGTGSTASDAGAASASSRPAFVPSRQALFVAPGVNQVIPIARGHLNRIVTPFADPVVHTTSRLQISSEGAVLYVASGAHAPSTLYVSPNGHQNVALSLTLLPKPIPPREVTLRIAGGGAKTWANTMRAGQWERARPYVQTLKKALRQLALGQVPSGYGMRAWRSGDPYMTCVQPGIEVEPGQVLSGAELILLAGVATNVADERVEIAEAKCRRPGVLAVAAWPKASLAPGQRTELYIVMRRPAPTGEARARPSLLDNGEASHE